MISEVTALSVVFPVFNEKENLSQLMEEIAEHIPQKYSDSFEVIAVDDCSTDGSGDLLRGLMQKFPKLRVILLRRHMGQSTAFDLGFKNARGRIIVSLDSDLQNDPHDIPRLIGKLEEGYDVVAGWRKQRKDGLFVHVLPSLIANFIIRRVTGSRVHDQGCSLRAYRAETLAGLKLYGQLHRFVCPLLQAQGARICELEVHHRPRRAGKSKYGFGRIFKVLPDLLYIWVLKNHPVRPDYVIVSGVPDTREQSGKG